MSTGRRYSLAEKREILRYRADHTYEATCQKFGVSQMTLARWSKRIMMQADNTTNTPKDSSPLVEKVKFLESLLQVLKFNEGVLSVSLVNDMGEIVTSVGTQMVGQELIAANTAAMLALGERSSRTFMQGNLDIIFTRSSEGATLIAGAGQHAVIVLLFEGSVDLIKLFTQDFPVIDKIRNVIKNLY
jgi:predicted regulator of Ras-like GTPase activity (Roadblock/LC7/MglB family)